MNWSFWKEPAGRGRSPTPSGSSLQPDLVVDRLAQSLLAPEVALSFPPKRGREETDLFKFPACRVAEARA